MAHNKEDNQSVPEDSIHSWEYSTDAQGRIAYISPFWRSSTGILPEDILKDPLSISRIIHPDDLPGYKEHIRNAYEKKLPGAMEYRILLPDNTIRWISHSCGPFFDEEGRYAGTRGRSWDITERKNFEHVVTVQRDLGLVLDEAASLQESLHLCLNAALLVSGLEAGGIYMLDQATGDLNLLLSSGHTDEFVRINRKLPVDSQKAQILMTGKPFYLSSQDIRELHAKDLLDEKMLSIAAVPLVDQGEVFGSLHIGSREHSEIPVHSRYALETIARQVGAAILRMQAEERLRASEAKYRAIFENAVEGIFQTTPEGGIMSVNSKMARLFGYDSPQDMMSRVHNVKELYANPEDRIAFRREIDRTGILQKYEVLSVRKDGTKMLIAVSAGAVKDKEGNVIYYDGFYEDITERKKMERDLRESEERLRGIVETSNAGIMMITLAGQILFANRQMAGMLGYDHERFVKGNYYDYVHADDKLNIDRNLGALERGDVDRLSVERRFLRADGTSWWGYVCGGRFQTAPGKFQVVLIISDMTHIKRVEEEKKLLEEHLRQAQKMEAIGTLAGGIAHDFNNILASMMGFTEMAARETRRAARNDYLDQVLLACERAKNLVNQILAFSRSREQERRPLDIRLVLKEALSLLRASLPSTIEIKSDIAREEMLVLADPTEIHQITMNLCTNAAHAMQDKGGVLTISLTSVGIPQAARPAHPDLQAGDYVRLSVSDTGHGIGADIKEKIFDPFFTTKKDQEGTGLGLSVVYGIVKNAGGVIDMQSVAGQGATFTIYLPQISPCENTEAGDRDGVDMPGSESILFVDDEEMLVRMAKKYFQEMGYQVTATTSSPEALQLFQENPARFDLVIADMTMPHITGTSLCRAFLKIRPKLPIILCTGYSDAASMSEIEKLNIRELVLKPVFVRDLGLRVRRILDKE